MVKIEKEKKCVFIVQVTFDGEGGPSTFFCDSRKEVRELLNSRKIVGEPGVYRAYPLKTRTEVRL